MHMTFENRLWFNTVLINWRSSPEFYIVSKKYRAGPKPVQTPIPLRPSAEFCIVSTSQGRQKCIFDLSALKELVLIENEESKAKNRLWIPYTLKQIMSA